MDYIEYLCARIMVIILLFGALVVYPFDKFLGLHKETYLKKIWEVLNENTWDQSKIEFLQEKK